MLRARRPLWLVPVWFAFSFVGCASILGDFSYVPGDGDASANGDATTDTGVTPQSDGAVTGDSASCNALQQLCNGECVLLEAPRHCGTCNHDCTTLPHTTTGDCKKGGTCNAVCAANYGHCGTDPDTGCETDLTTPQNCGACGKRCDASSPICAQVAGGGYQCTLTCPVGQMNCNGSCTDLNSNPAHCGTCFNDCTKAADVRTVTCGGVPATCAVTQCLDGYGDCNKAADDGCEVALNTDSNCGGCGIQCGAVSNGTTTCTPSAGTYKCLVQKCSPGYDDCDKDPKNGCEALLNTTSNCGACGNACGAVNNGLPQCIGGTTCSLSCNAGYADCDKVVANGCEVNTLSDSKNCGTCNNVCAASCSGGLCAVVNHWPDSYEDYCVDGAGASIACSSATAVGQDGTYHTNVPTYTVANGTVFDSVTSLTWEQTLNGGATTAIDQPTAISHCASVNSAKLAGYTDWRLPSMRELSTIIDTGALNTGRLPTAIFKNQQGNAALWSSTDGASNASLAWNLGTNWSNVQLNSKTATWPGGALCVRGALPAGSIVANTANTATDTRSNLTWQRAAGGTYTWPNALAYCEALTLDGFSDWRLPSYKELWSIVDSSKAAPAVDSTIFSGASAVHWTSSATTYAFGSVAHAIDVDLTTGYQSTLAGDVATATKTVRCVRGQ